MKFSLDPNVLKIRMTKFLTFIQILIEKYDGEQTKNNVDFLRAWKIFVRRRNDTGSGKKTARQHQGQEHKPQLTCEFLTQSEFSRLIFFK